MIYEIHCNKTNENYIGSTFNLSKRIISHRSNKAEKGVCKSRQIIDRGDFTIKVIETLQNPTKQELLTREKYYIKSKECINILSPIDTPEERKEKMSERGKLWRERNKEYKAKKNKEYQEINKEKINLQRSAIIHCTCGADIAKWSLHNHKKTKFHLENV